MSKTEKENRINSLAITFLERQQIQPNIFADQIIRGYKEGYHQAEKDLELTWEDLKLLQDISHEVFAEVANGSVDYYQIYPTEQSFLEEVLKRFKVKKGE